MGDWAAYAAALLPSIGVGYLFYVIVKHLLEGDRNERAAMARWEKEQDRAKAAPGVDNDR